MDNAEQVIAQGKKAHTLMQDAVFVKAMDNVRAKQTQTIVGSGPQQRDEREAAYFILHALDLIVTELNSMRNNGVYEEAQVARKRKN